MTAQFPQNPHYRPGSVYVIGENEGVMLIGQNPHIRSICKLGISDTYYIQHINTMFGLIININFLLFSLLKLVITGE